MTSWEMFSFLPLSQVVGLRNNNDINVIPGLTQHEISSQVSMVSLLGEGDLKVTVPCPAFFAVLCHAVLCLR